MQPHHKAETLNIRASAAQKAKLAEAAKLQNMNVSQFVLNKSLDAAEQVIADQLLIRLSAQDFDHFAARLEEPSRDLPALRLLFSGSCTLEP